MSESRCEHSATYRRLQANQQITDVVSLKLRFATEFSFAHNTVVLKSAGRGSVCALSHFTPVYTTVLTSWWVSEDMSLPTTRQPALNMPTWRCWQSWKYITFSLRPTIQLHSALTIYTIVWLTDIFDFVHRLIFLPNNGVSEANPASLYQARKEPDLADPLDTATLSHWEHLCFRYSAKQEDYVGQYNNVNTNKTTWSFLDSPESQSIKNCPTVVEPCSWKNVPGSYPQPLESTLTFLQVRLNVTLSPRVFRTANNHIARVLRAPSTYMTYNLINLTIFRCKQRY